MFIIPWVRTTPSASNDKARLAEIEAIVERGTLVIDDSVYADTIDRIFVRGHFFSNKPPMLSVLASAIYAPEHWILHWSFRKHPQPIVYSVTFLIVGGAAGMLLTVFHVSLGLWHIPEWQRLALTIALGSATFLLPYSTVFNNHVVAAALSFSAFWLLFRSRVLETRIRSSLTAAGFLAGLTAAIDVVTGGVFLGLFTAYIFAWPCLRRSWFSFAAAAAVPIAGFFALNMAITGGVIPPYNNFAFYQYPGSDWKDPALIAGTSQAVTASREFLGRRLQLMLLSQTDSFHSCRSSTRPSWRWAGHSRAATSSGRRPWSRAPLRRA